MAVLLGAGGGGGHKGAKERVRAIGAREKFGVELRPQHERMVAELGDLDEAAIGRETREDEALGGEWRAIGVVKLPSMPMPFVGGRARR